jgi:hypothetical protein
MFHRVFGGTVFLTEFGFVRRGFGQPFNRSAQIWEIMSMMLDIEVSMTNSTDGRWFCRPVVAA